MFKTIRSKFIFLSLAIIVTGVIIGNLLIINQLKNNFHKQTVLMLETTLDILRNGLDNEMMSSKTKDIQHILDNLGKNDNIDHIRIIDHNGTIKYSTNISEKNKSISVISPGFKNINEIITRTITPSPDNYRFSASEPILNSQQCRTCHGDQNIIAYLDVETNLKNAENKFYEGTLNLVLITAIIIILLSFSFYTIFNRLINKPLTNFIKALNKVKDGTLDIMLPQKQENEFSQLHSHFNNMVNKLKESKIKIEEMHAEQLQRADRLVTLGELTAEMAHEINNHTAIIMSRADYLSMETDTDKRIKDYADDLNAILHQSTQVSKITGNILRHSKKYPKHNQQIDLVNMVNDCINILNPLIIKRKINVTKNYSMESAVILGDQLDIEQAIMNLLTNAIDAIEKEGSIIVKIYKNEKEEIIFTISDNGCGIESEIMDHIFQPFFTTKNIERGTGLGLYIVKKICDNNRADISFKSTPGSGTTFSITFKGEKI